MATLAGKARMAKGGRLTTVVGVLLAVAVFGAVLIAGRATGSSAGNLPVVVAATAIPPRTQLQASDLKIAYYSQPIVGSFSNIRQAQNMVAQVNFAVGQPVLSNELSDTLLIAPATRPAYLPIPAGYVAMTLPLNDQMGVAGYIQPDDRIDVLATINTPAGSITKVTLTNLRVLTVGDASTSTLTGPAASASTASATSITVLVQLQNAEYLKWLVDNANLRYVLKSYLNYDQQEPATQPVGLPQVERHFGF